MTDTSGFTEFECVAKLKNNDSFDSVQEVSSLLVKSGYLFDSGLGYVLMPDDAFGYEYPAWNEVSDIFDSLAMFDGFEEFGMSFCSKQGLPKLSLSFSHKYQMFSASINEGYYIDRENKRIIRENFDDIVRLFESIVALLSVKSWLIFPNTASFDELLDYDFIEYTGECYPKSDLIETIRWYDENMFGKKN